MGRISYVPQGGTNDIALPAVRRKSRRVWIKPHSRWAMATGTHDSI